MSYTKVPSLKKPLAKQIDFLRKSVGPKLPSLGCEGMLLIGSCSAGKATFTSDIDLLLILSSEPLGYSRVQTIRDGVEKIVGSAGQSPLPLQVNVVLPSVFQTEEPAMKKALKGGVILADPDGKLASKIPGKRKRA